jgi:hypothetical protein
MVGLAAGSKGELGAGVSVGIWAFKSWIEARSASMIPQWNPAQAPTPRNNSKSEAVKRSSERSMGSA